MEISKNNLSFTGPARYRIVIQGSIPNSYEGRLGAMKLVKISYKESGDESVLEGRIADQAELAGILTTLYKLHLPILRISLKNNPKQV
jgi:hypothetical protein